MKIDFNNLEQDAYELFLPLPVFSELSIKKALKSDSLFRDIITIECDRPFMTHVEVTGDFLRVEEEKFEGQKLTIPYSIDTKHSQVGTLLEGFILFTYLGGETKVPVHVSVTNGEADMVMDQQPLETVAERSENVKSKSYTVKTSKKAYDLDETAVVVIMNHEPYPIAVTVISGQDSLVASDRHLTIQDIATLKIRLKQSWTDKHITKKPVTNQWLSLAISHENGEETIRIPIHFTAYKVVNTGKITNSDRDYKKRILMSQHHYNSYIIKGTQVELLSAKRLIEEAMAYYTTAVELRIFHILLLCELNRKSDVQEQINEILNYNSYYLDDSLDEFVEILKVLSDWLSGTSVDSYVRTWPLTGYRQLFKLRVLGSGIYGYDECERLYDNGFKSTHLFAHAAALMRALPLVPSTDSIFYKSLLMWSISKNAFSELWLTYLDKANDQVIKHQLMNGLSAGQLYALHPSEGTLKIYVAAVIHESKYEVQDHAIVLEALKNKCAIEGLQVYYVHTAMTHRLPLTFDDLHLQSLIRELTYEESLYLIRCYLEDTMTDKSPHLPVMRQFREALKTCMGRSLTEDEVALVSYDLDAKIQRHQWASLRSDYEDLHLEELQKQQGDTFEKLLIEGAKPIGYPWLSQRVAPELLADTLDVEQKSIYIDWLIDNGFYDDVGEIHQQKHLSDVPVSQVVLWCVQLLEADHPYGRILGRALFDEGVREEAFLNAYQKCYVGSLKALLAFYDQIKGVLRVSGELSRTILYKGVLTRQYPEEVLTVYLRYRDTFEDDLTDVYMKKYFAARILIEDSNGYERLVRVFEEDVDTDSVTGEPMSPSSLALLKLYQAYGSDNEDISGKLIKKAVKNGLIFPWFSDMAKPYIQTGSLRKAAFFSYHSKPWLGIKMYYRSDDQRVYTCLQMKHVFFGFYIGYVMAFFKDRIQYYFEETSLHDHKEITESGIYVHEILAEPEGLFNNYDVINTIVTSEEMDDDESIEITIREHMEYRDFIHHEMELL